MGCWLAMKAPLLIGDPSGRHLRGSERGRNRLDTKALFCQLQRQGLSQTDDAEFAPDRRNDLCNAAVHFARMHARPTAGSLRAESDAPTINSALPD